jgi:hypothetical protein
MSAVDLKGLTVTLVLEKGISFSWRIDASYINLAGLRAANFQVEYIKLPCHLVGLVD